MKIFKNGLSLICSMVLMVTLVLAIFAGAGKSIILNENTYLKIMEKRDFYNSVSEGIQHDLEYALIVNNIAPEYAAGVINEKEVEDYIKSILNKVMVYLNQGENNIAPLDLKVHEERINGNLDKFLRDNGLYLDKETTAVISDLEGKLLQVVRNNLEFIKESTAIKKITKVTTLFSSKLVVICFMATLIPIALIAIIWGKKYKDSLRWIAYGFMTSGFLIFMVFISGYFSKFYNNVIIGIPYLKVLVATVIKTILLRLSIIGLIVGLIGIPLLIPKLKQYYKRSLYRV